MDIWLLKGVFLAGLILTTLIRQPYLKANRANKKSDERKTPREKALLGGAFLGMMILPVLHALTPLLHFANYAQPLWLDALGIAVWIVMIWLFRRSHYDLGVNWSPTLEVREGHTLITNGIYQKIRHPMYAACWLWAIEQGLLLRNWIAGWAGLLAFGTLYFLRVAHEERMMLDQFGGQYQNYMERTGRLLPKAKQFVAKGFFLLTLSLVFSVAARAQSATATLSGIAQDTNGAAISGALVRLLAGGQSTERSVTTDQNGRYEFTCLERGGYRLSISANGFAPGARTVQVNGTEQRVNVTLQAAALSENVVVSATRTPESLATIPGGVSVLTQQQIQANTEGASGLNDALGKLVPGLAAGSQGSTIFGQTLRGRQPLVVIDGIPQITTRNGSRDLATLDPATIERVEVIRGSTAIYGEGATGGIISITTKDANAARPLNFTTDFGFGNSLTHPGDSFSPFIRQTLSGKYNEVDYLFGGNFEKVGGFFDADGDRIAPDPFAQGGPSDTRSYSLNFKLGHDHTKEQRSQISLSRYNALQDTEYANDPAVIPLPLRSVKARALRGLEQDEPQAHNNLQADYRYLNRRLFNSLTRLNVQLYRREYLTRFAGFDGRPQGTTTGRNIIQSSIDSKKTGGRVTFDSPIRTWGLTAVYGLDHVVEHTAQPPIFPARSAIAARRQQPELFARDGRDGEHRIHHQLLIDGFAPCLCGSAE